MRSKLIQLASEMKIKKLSFVSGSEGTFLYNGNEINFKINSPLKTTIWIDTQKDKGFDKILYTVRQNSQVEIFEFSELNILEAIKELNQMGKI